MAIELTMPALSPTMEKGTLARWLVAVGDRVVPGDLLAEIETDKATMEFEAIDEGRIAALLVPEGTDDVAVGAPIARLDTDDEAASTPKAALPEPAPIPISEANAPPGAAVAVGPAAAPEAEDIRATPLARRLAAASGIPLAGIAGSGAGGKVTRADLKPFAAPLGQDGEAAAEPVATSQPTPAPSFAPPPPDVPVETVKLGAMRRTIARRLTEAKQTVPHFYLTVRCRLDALLALRAELNAAIATRGVRISVNDMMMKAMAAALVEVPDANVQFGGDVLHRFGRVDLSVAVAIDGGLVTPVVRDVGTLSLSAIARQTQALATSAREGKLAPADYQGGTASISNLGMFGIDEMVPVINPPQAVILGVGAGVAMPWQVDGAIALATIAALTASFDHRAIDGAAAAAFMAALRNVVENPRLLLV